MNYVKTKTITHAYGETERVDIWECLKCGPKSAALNMIETLMGDA